MRFKEKVYDKYRSIVSTSSDICEFVYPPYTANGMGLIDDGMTLASTNLYLLDNDVDLGIDITFTDNLAQLSDTTFFNFSVLPYNQNAGEFDVNNIYISNAYKYETPNHQESINSSVLFGEGEYIFKVGFQFDACVEIANKLGKRVVSNTFNPSLPYGNYDKNLDKYFVVLYKAEEPRLDIGITDDGINNNPDAPTTDNLFITPLVVENNKTKYTIGVTASSELIITFNGSFLTKDQDYTLDGTLLTFFEPTLVGDLINIIYIGRSNNSGLKIKNIDVDGPISQGVTDGQLGSDVYYNTDTSKYEIYTDYKVSNSDSVIVMLNGQALNNSVDYYVSETNKKRIILSGDIYVNDIITIIYDSGENLIRGVTSNDLNISWFVENNITNTNGEFIIEVSKYANFVTIEQTISVPYVINQVKYTKNIPLNYDYGQVLYYRVRNLKKYTTINGDELNTEKSSDAIRIEIKTNISNNY